MAERTQLRVGHVLALEDLDAPGGVLVAEHGHERRLVADLAQDALLLVLAIIALARAEEAEQPTHAGRDRGDRSADRCRWREQRERGAERRNAVCDELTVRKRVAAAALDLVEPRADLEHRRGEADAGEQTARDTVASDEVAVR